ncbi:hypothetical protein CTRI78_v003041 [Colletotrichum trifolii]|uniref:Uncharacterized protein n=1 Tax=Colletotrichum trifolii TaxID=5466 RepID=A0A4R8RKD1_COLTR|nr:hypothetical protein CTRI78_v003041 [Colletotrichum trifolii]
MDSRQSQDSLLLKPGDGLSSWSLEEQAAVPEETRTSRGRVRRLLRLRRQHGGPQDVATSRSLWRRKKTSQDSDTKKSVDENDETSSPFSSWAYNLSIGLAWYMPAPFDLMPQGYPSRVI